MFSISRWTQYVLRTPQHVRAHHNVRVLHVGRHWAGNAEILVVEEIFDRPSNGTRKIRP